MGAESTGGGGVGRSLRADRVSGRSKQKISIVSRPSGPAGARGIVPGSASEATSESVNG